MKRIKAWLKNLFGRRFIKVRAIVWRRCSNGATVAVGEPWLIRWPKAIPIPNIGDLAMLPSPHFFISSSEHYIPVVIAGRAIYTHDRSVDLYVYDVKPGEDWRKKARSILKGD
ncbi:MAG: hypothetical protein COU29_04315 [Candidatus Magasanikbacteria bacterium CG10_big_fil_rev_8_21_14_0_10_36_32]|uniref:Uncharacterized protein n=1 Tax=Candidatus Magasanikbacteria bacterium CG10_big_fil_rev_8_21_14_0_10_36_32 TaxID=1974646 RepID=A0A2M6W5D6_9BACT|nr:MAG: hypothetical protein COU29_04315 [Candidatus Magasanikbacteria bacterium CG10_big_fil_rev_8_21_14_0_10_36_32]